MSVVVVGVHERDVPLELLEQVSVSDDELAKSLRRLCDSPHLSEVVIVSTCLRTEVYAVVERFHDGLGEIEGLFESRASDQPGIAAHLYLAIDDAAVAHLFEVAAGIDSAVLGEGEILRQVRQAHERARAEGTTGPVLERMFRHSIEVGKRARSETAIARGITSLSHAAVALAREVRGGSLSSDRVLVVGSGEMGAGTIEMLRRSATPAKLSITNRSRERAAALAAANDAETLDFEQLASALSDVDVLLTCTAAPGILLGAPEVAAAMTARGGRALLVVDAAVPRDVDPACREIEGVALYDIDDIRAFAERQMGARSAEIEPVRQIVVDELERYRAAAAARDAVPLLTALRARAEEIRLGELDRHRGTLASLDGPTREAVESVTRGIISKLMHEPTVRLKDTAGSPRGERLAEALRALFDI